MISLNEKNYKLYYLDTCVLSEMVKDRSGFGSDLLNIVLEDGIIAVALNSIWELKSAPIVYRDVIDVISVLPTVILKNEEMIFEEEYKLFNDSTHSLSPIMACFSSTLFKNYGIDILKTFEEKVTDDKNEMVKKERNKTFEILGKMPSKIFSRGELKTISSVESSVELSAFILATNYIMSELQEYMKGEREFPIKNFPSLMSTSYALHYKYLQAERKGSVSDIEDILMSALYPYVDVVVTERNQCNIIRQIQKRHGYFEGLETLNMEQVKKHKNKR
ncbi:hypothetical protein [Mucilaginibacter frigoritolerans]|nr:hypothetical protein [Mucilaginibacter frigoritolerans]